jgi:3-hydroxymyristoyl/3-hydroxydecanoyl-(acyl carrier protein) dehydratase
MWYEISQQIQGNDNLLTAEVRVPKESPWFDGHFPGNPVLPGVAQLGMVFTMIQNTLKDPVKLTSVSRVRFKQMILPDDNLNVVVIPNSQHKGTYTFRITKSDELVSSGNMRVDTI